MKRWLRTLAVALLLLRPGYGWAALAFDATSTANTASATSVTFAHTTTGSDRVLIVGASWRDGFPLAVCTGITYNGVAMTALGDHKSGTLGICMYALVAPATGANNVVITMDNAPNRLVGGAVSFTGANQSTPTGTYAEADGASTVPSVDVSSATGEIVVDTLAFGDASATVGSGQTQRWQVNDADDFYTGAGSTEAGATTVTMSWSTGFGTWVIGGVSVKEAAAAAAPIFYRRRVN